MLKRKKHKMSPPVKTALDQAGLMRTYQERPPYQQNDYIWWINDARREETKQKRLQQMLSELKKGNVYMKMKWNRVK